jgi:hypothetical protein
VITQTLAPCGHPGRVVIGTYVECSLKCAEKSAPVRGVPGHVVMCACKPCQVRRDGVRIVLRSKDGKDVVSMPWDGIARQLVFSSAARSAIRHWWLLDKDDCILASGALSFDMVPDFNYTCEFDVCTLGTPGIQRRTKGLIAPTRSDLEGLISAIPDVKDFEISYAPNMLKVRLLDLAVNDVLAQRSIVNRVAIALWKIAPAGIEVRNCTYESIVARATHAINFNMSGGVRLTADLVKQTVEDELKLCGRTAEAILLDDCEITVKTKDRDYTSRVMQLGKD